jgi:outer membrane protein OmpA-like peptidoglycan-associated protein
VYLRLTSFILIAAHVAAGSMPAQAQDSMACERKIEKVLIPEVMTYGEWQGAERGKVVASRIPAGTMVRRCAPNHRLGIELDGQLVWIDSFAIQIEGADRSLSPPLPDHEKTAGQRAQAPQSEMPAKSGTVEGSKVRNTDRVQIVDADQIIRALRPHPLTRGLTVGEREEIAEISRTKPTVDLEVYFDYGSASLTPTALAALKEIGRAMSEDPLKGTVLFINGHADGRGGATQNYRLSERRAQAVRRYLIKSSGLPPASLIATGFGKERLKNPDQPFSDENRRVQLLNIGIKAAGK